MKLSTMQEDVSVVNVASNEYGHIQITHVWSIFCCLILVKEAQHFRCSLCFFHLAKYATYFTIAIAAHIGSSEGTAVSISHFHMMMEAHTGCETTFFNQTEMVNNAPCPCQFNTTALTHILRSM